ncbi:MAG: cation diffusion facilitator family transporter [Nitrospirales bacterium]
MTTTVPTYYQLKSRLCMGLAINAVIIVAEFIGGYWTNSIALMSDAGHNLIDQGSLFLALYAHILAARPATEDRTFGYHRAGIVSAFINGFVLLITAGILALIAIYRLTSPVIVPGDWMIVIALVSFLANLSVAWLLQQGAKDDLNIRGAFLHMLADAWVSLGVVACGIGILYTGWTALDPMISLIIVVVIGKGAWPIFRESLDVLLESTPPNISATNIVTSIERLAGVRNVHDLHIWAVEPRLIMLTCHVLIDSEQEHAKDFLLNSIQSMIISDFGIQHHTIQLETHCTESETIHCDLNRLTNGEMSTSFTHSHSAH